MPLTTTITPAKIAVALGTVAPETGSVTEQQWQMWIDDAVMLIQTRVDGTTPTPSIDQVKLDYVVREAVVAHVKRPEDATQVTISVDDGSTSKSYRSGNGRVTIIDDWWSMLGLGPRDGKAFETDTMPAGAGVGRCGVDYWWSSPNVAEPI